MKIDMSPAAVTERLRKTSELRRLCFALGGDRLKQKLEEEASALRRIKQKSAATENQQKSKLKSNQDELENGE